MEATLTFISFILAIILELTFECHFKNNLQYLKYTAFTKIMSYEPTRKVIVYTFTVID